MPLTLARLKSQSTYLQMMAELCHNPRVKPMMRNCRQGLMHQRLRKKKEKQ
jgi:hypothetical protein